MTVIIRYVAGLAALAALITACASPLQVQPRDPAAEIAVRPTSQTMVARYDQMQEEIRNQLDAAIGPFKWETHRSANQAPCEPPYSETDGITVSLAAWGCQGGIPDPDWPHAKQIIDTITAQYGLTTPTLQIDQPGRHQTSATDPHLGAYFEFGTAGNADMQATTGCHRPA